MISPIRVLLALVLQSLIAAAAPVGICLHAYSPEAPAEKIECFEFEKVERAGADYQFYTATSSFKVTTYRFRGTIPYKPELAPTHPEFDKLLKLYEETARATPSTRRYLNPKILAMRGQAAGVAKQIEDVAKLPTITIADGTLLIGCTMSRIENGFAVIRHQDGISKVSLTDLDATEKKALNSTAEGWSLEDPVATPKDSTGTFAKIVFKNGLLLKKAKFKEVADGTLVFMADGKSVSVPADQFPGELSVLGEEVVKSLAPVKNEASPEPSVASSGGDNPQAVPVQSKRANETSGGGFVLPSDEASGGGFVLPDKARSEAEIPIPETAVQKKSLPSRSKKAEIAETKREAEQGMQETVDLAERYIIGERVIQNLPEAVRLLRETADRGYADAQFHLGCCYSFGRGLAKDDAAAVSWFQKAADQGHPEAQFNLASCYYQGTGVAPDKKKWIEWLQKSADGKFAEAQGAMGVAYLEGIGVQKNEARAIEYLQMASEQNYAKAQYELGDLYYWGKGVHEDKAKATKLFLLSAEGGYAKAQSFVGAMYHHAWGVPMDFVKGTKWYMSAASQGVPNDQCTVGNCYAKGRGVEQSDTKAFEWYLKAAEQGSDYGQYYVGLCYKEGRGVPENRTMAMKYFQSAAEQGNSDAKAEMLVSQKPGKGKNWNPIVIGAMGLMLVLAIVKVAFVVMKRSSRIGDIITKPQQSSKASSRAKIKFETAESSPTEWIKFTCPDCENHISKEQQFAGGSVECPTCGIEVVVPAASVAGKTDHHENVNTSSVGNPVSAEAATEIALPLYQPTVDVVRNSKSIGERANVSPDEEAAEIQFANSTAAAVTTTDGAGHSSLPPRSSTDSDPSSSKSVWDRSRLPPLLFCVIGLGWVLPTILPARIFTGAGVQIPLGALAIPLFLWSFLVLVRPDQTILTKRFLGSGIGACLFTWFIGIALLLAVQKIGEYQLGHFKMRYGKAGLFSVISWVIGWLYQGAFDPNVGLFHRILGFVFGVGLCEEFIKIVPVILFVLLLRKDSSQNDKKEFNLSKEMVLVGMFSGIGFGLGEAVSSYSPSAGHGLYSSLITRWFAVISSHAIWTGIVAQLLWMIRDDLRRGSIKKVVLIGLAVSMSSGFLHGIYDLICGYWILAVFTNVACVFLLFYLIRECEKPEKAGKTTMPWQILYFESWLRKRPIRKFGVAMAYVIIIFGIGSFGWSRADLQRLSDSDSQSSVNVRSEQPRQETNRAGYNAYMEGYNNPAQGDVAEAMIERFSGADRQAALLMILGAEDRRKGLSIRFVVVAD